MNNINLFASVGIDSICSLSEIEHFLYNVQDEHASNRHSNGTLNVILKCLNPILI